MISHFLDIALALYFIYIVCVFACYFIATGNSPYDDKLLDRYTGYTVAPLKWLAKFVTKAWRKLNE